MPRLLTYLLFGAGCAAAVCYAWMLKSVFRDYFDLLAAADPELFPLPEILRSGFRAAEVFGGAAGTLFRSLASAGGGSVPDGFCAYCAASWALGTVVPAFSFGCFLAVMTGNPAVLLPVLAGGAALALYPAERFRERQKRQREELENELPSVISKTLLLNETGMTPGVLWDTVAHSGTGEIYRRMCALSDRVRNGQPMTDALLGFAAECPVREGRQLAGILLRCCEKGGENISDALRSLNAESWENRKQRAKLRGHAASEALIVPMLLIFIGILAMILVPLLSGIRL